MRLPARLAAAALVLLLGSAALFSQSGMSNGANHLGSISAPGEIDVFTFNAVAGDAIMLAIGEVGTNSAFVPWIRLTSPTAQLLGSQSGTLAAQIETVATVTGTYTVQVASNDAGGDDTGDYTLTLAKTGDTVTISPGDEGGPMVNGSNHTGNIHVGDLDVWTFTATAGDALMLAIGEVGADSLFTPWIRLKSPTGQNLGSQAGALAAQIETVATVTGTYLVIVSTNDAFRDATGSYTLTLAKAPGALTPGDDGGPMTNGSNHTGSIHVGDLDTWTFNATAGDAIMLAIGEVGADSLFTPWIRLKSPTGQNLGSQAGTLAAQIETTATVSGTYTVVVSTNDAFRDATGSYTLTVATTGSAYTTSGGDEGAAMVNGGNHAGLIHVGDLDVWTFNAIAGDALMLAIGEVGADSLLTPWIRLKSPTGQNLGSQSGTLAAQIETTATVSGTYTVVVSTNDAFRDATGSYTLTLARTGAPYTTSGGDEGAAMVNGSNHAGSIHVGDLDVWTFTATAGDAIMLAIGEVGTDSQLAPWIRLKSPTGQNLGSQSGTLAAQIETTATVSGTYTVVVSTNDSFHDATGNYTLTVARTGAPYTTSGGDEGTAMVNGANHIGSIHVGDLDVWTFNAIAGESLMIAIGETGIDQPFTPWIRLKSPTGQNLGSLSGPLAAQIDTTATVTGTYTVVVSTNDAFRDATGTYTLTIANTPRAFAVSPGDQGGATAGGVGQGTIHIGDLDIWTFVAHEGDQLAVTITELGSPVDFNPWIRLRSPTGLNSGSQSGATSAVINATAPETGIYTVVVSTADAFFDGSGDYNLSVSGNSASMIRNGDFSQGETFWQFFATPTSAYIVHQVVNGVLEYYRVPPPPGSANQAVAFQHTGVAVPALAPIVAQFDLANTSTLRKRIAVLVLDADFSDLSVCTFWLEPNTPLRTYQMRTHTTEAWTNAALYFYAATAGSDGGVYQVDNVSMAYVPDEDADRTDCVDPTTPVPGGGPDGPNLIGNGDFGTGSLAPWSTFSVITQQITNGVLEFINPALTQPSGVVFQATGQAIGAGEIITATFELGNSSNVRKRVTVLLNDADFSDLSACTFWLPPGQPLSAYAYRTFTTEAWGNAMLSIYPATVGAEQWILLDNVTMQRTPSATIVGTECIEPGAASLNLVQSAQAAQRTASTQQSPRSEAQTSGVASMRFPTLPAVRAQEAGGSALVLPEVIDLVDAENPRLLFESLVEGSSGRVAVEVSLDGETWITLAELAPSNVWRKSEIDLSAFRGETLRVRFVLDADTSATIEEWPVWRIRRLRIVR